MAAVPRLKAKSARLSEEQKGGRGLQQPNASFWQAGPSTSVA